MRILTDGLPLGASEGSTGSAEGRDVLEVLGVTKRFGAQTALDDVGFVVAPGRVTGLIGQNGAGKSTLLGVISGKYRPTAGVVRLDEQLLIEPHRVSNAGGAVAVVYQEGSIIPALSVADNLLIRECIAHPLRTQVSRGRARASVSDAYAALGLRAPDPLVAAGSLSPADTKLLEIVRAFTSPARFILLDEPTASLDPDMSQWLLHVIRQAAADRQIGVVFVSHRLREVEHVSDTVTVLRNGRVVWAGDSGALTSAEMVEHIAGKKLPTATARRREGRSDAGSDALVGLTGVQSGALRGVDMSIRRGEIVGIAAVEGQGQRELLYSIAGLLPHSGDVRLNGKALRLRSRLASQQAGVLFLADDRARQGVIGPMTIADNMLVSAVSNLARRWGARHRKNEQSFVAMNQRQLAIKMPGTRAGMHELSGGNQQKVLLARALSVRGDLVVLYEPTQGVDVGVKEEIYALLRRLRDEDKSVLIYSSDEEELCLVCDRVLVLGAGRIVRELEAETLTRDQIVQAMVAYSHTARAEIEPFVSERSVRGG